MMTHVFRTACLAASLILLAGCATPRQAGEEMRYLCGDREIYRLFPYTDANQAELLTLVLPDGKR